MAIVKATSNKTYDSFVGNNEPDIIKVADMLYPIGIEVTFYNNDDRTNWLGFTWQRCSEGKFDVGISTTDSEFDTIGKTGGQKITQHAFPLPGINTYNFQATPDKYLNKALELMSNHLTTKLDSIAKHVVIDTVGGPVSVGDTSAVEVSFGYYNTSNIPPYEVKAKWKRVA